METRDHHCHNVIIHFVQLTNTFLWTSWLYGYASFLYRQNNSSLGGIFWTKKTKHALWCSSATISPPRHHCWGQQFWFIFQTSSSIISNILEMNSHAIALLTNSSFDISPSPSMSTISKISFVLSFRTSSGTCAQKLIVIMVTILASTSIPTIV